MEDIYDNYLELLSDTRSFNSHLWAERRSRLPFIDGSTGVAQVDSQLWRPRDQRCQLGPADSSKQPQATLYEYPALRWHGARRAYLLAGPPDARQPGGPGQSACWPQPASPTSANQCPASACHASAVGSAGRGQRPAPSGTPPTRADSTGSHSCNTADSDSRDLSFATSHSFDSQDAQQHAVDDEPHYSQTQHHQHHNHHSHHSHHHHHHHHHSHGHGQNQAQGQSQQQANNGDPNSGGTLAHLASQSTNSTIDEQTPATRVSPLAYRAQDQHCRRSPTPHNHHNHHHHHHHHHHRLPLDDQTKAAIKLHSKISKKRKRDMGQSLMKDSSNNGSILVKSLTKLTNATLGDEGDDDSSSLDDGSGTLGPSPTNELESGSGPASSTERPAASGQPTQHSPANNRLDLTQHALILPGERPYVCSYCDQTYKTRPGLSYHFIHTHNQTLPRNLPVRNKLDPAHKQTTAATRAKPAARRTKSKTAANSSGAATNGRMTRSQERFQAGGSSGGPDSAADCHRQDLNDDTRLSNANDSNQQQTGEPLNGYRLNHRQSDDRNQPGADTPNSHRPPHQQQMGGALKSNPFCDFCLGTVDRNRRTRQPEQLVSCSNCGSSGHPSCLRFSENIIRSVARYDWQCIECKTCSKCNAADNEAQLLFCDDCDRSYHTYCLEPPLSEPPEGNWSCTLCIQEYHTTSPKPAT